MSGTSGLICSECGCTAAREQVLRKARRRWRWLVIALLLPTVAAYMNIAWPRTRAHGPIGLAPTTGLIVAMPWLTEPVPEPTFRWSGAQVDLESGQLLTKLRASGLHELSRRQSENELTDWQWQALLWRCRRGDADAPPLSPAWLQEYQWFTIIALGQEHWDDAEFGRWLARHMEIDITARPRIVRNRPVHITIAARTMMPDLGWTIEYRVRCEQTVGDGQVIRDLGMTSAFPVMTPIHTGEPVRLGRVVGDPESLDVTIDVVRVSHRIERPIERFEFHLPVDVVNDSSEAISVVRSPVIDFALAQFGRAHGKVRISQHGPWITIGYSLNSEGRDILENAGGPIIAARIELLRDGKVVWHGEAVDTPTPVMRHADLGYSARPTNEWRRAYRLASEVSAPDHQRLFDLMNSGGDWRLRICSDPHLALAYVHADVCWAGEVTIPFEWVVTRR